MIIKSLGLKDIETNKFLIFCTKCGHPVNKIYFDEGGNGTYGELKIECPFCSQVTGSLYDD